MSDRSGQTLGEFIRVKHGFAFSGDKFGVDLSRPTVVTPANFEIGGGFKEAKPKTFDGTFDDAYVLAPGDLIVSMTDLSRSGDTLGTPAFVPDSGVFLHNQRIGLIEILKPEAVDRKFLGYLLRTASYRQHILGSATGSTVRHTSPDRITSYPVSLPSVATQVAIKEVLGALDGKIAANSRAAQTSRQLADTLYDQAVAGRDSVRMSDVVTPILGGTPSRERPDYWGGSNGWVSARDVTAARGGVVLSTVESISDSAILETKAKPLRAGSVVLTARGTVGAVARLGIASSFNQSCYGFEPDVLPAGVLYFAVLRASKHLRSMAHGSVFDTITMGTFAHLWTPRLDSSDIAQLEALLSPLLDGITNAMTENDKLVALRDMLLPQLMSGKLRVRDAETTIEGVL